MRHLTVGAAGLALVLIGCCAAAEADEGPSPPPGAQPRVLTNPPWIQLPNGKELAAAYPPDALKHRVEGHSTMRCTVTAAGTLTNCVVTEETPAGQGFGAAELSISSKLRMQPQTADGRPVEGATVDVPVAWRIDDHPTPPLLPSPHWVRTPNGDDFARVYPSAAMRRGIEGHTTMRCDVKADGTLTNCVVTEETPKGAGFGDAALKLAPKFRMTPTTDDGKSVEGGSVIIPISWKLK
jgi:TonB family protein